MVTDTETGAVILEGDVYADIKYGKSVYVQLIPCNKIELNTMEKELIRSFNAKQSYNKTGGGSASW